MKNKILIGAALLVSVICFFSFKPNEIQHSSNGLKWTTFNDVDKLMKKKTKKNIVAKKYVVDVYTDWCGWCKKMDKATFEDSAVGAYANPKFYSIKLNAESKNIIKYKGKEMTEAELAATWGVRGYPTTVYLDENQEVITQISSYLDPNQFIQVLKFTGENIYKTKTWEQFVQQ